MQSKRMVAPPPLPAGPPQATPQPISPAFGETWQTVAPAPAYLLNNPLLLTDGTVIVLQEFQAEILRDRRTELTMMHGEPPDQAPEIVTFAEGDRGNGPALSPRELTYCFLRLGNLDGGAFERLGRYNAALWKQTAQTLLLLGSIRRQ
jgi:hypothetical protein